MLVVLLAWAAMSVRTYWAEAQSQPALVFTLAGLGGIIVVAVAGWLIRHRDHGRPWVMLGALSMMIGLAFIPLSIPLMLS